MEEGPISLMNKIPTQLPYIYLIVIKRLFPLVSHFPKMFLKMLEHPKK
jgi:hypothetical protein